MGNAIIENIKTRRSIRKFKKDPLPKDIIEKIVEAGTFAPSALNRQPWKFIVINNRELIEELSMAARQNIKCLHKLVPILRWFSNDLKDPQVIGAINKTVHSPEDTIFYNAPLVIAIAADARLKETNKDACLAGENMTLMAHSLGIGSCFIGRGRAIPKKLLLERFNLPGYYSFPIFMVFGYPDETRTAPPRKSDTVKWI